MPKAITNTSPMLYLYRIGVLEWLPQLCDDIWIPQAVVDELQDGQRKGYDVPIPGAYSWLQVVEPQTVPSEWLALDLGAGELAVLTIALAHPQRMVLLEMVEPVELPRLGVSSYGERSRFCWKPNRLTLRDRSTPWNPD